MRIEACLDAKSSLDAHGKNWKNALTMVNLQLNDTVAAALTAKAAAQGISVQAYLESLLVSNLPPSAVRISADELDRRLDELAIHGPSPQGTFSRAELYSDHD